MIRMVRPIEALRAIQYTGENTDDLKEFCGPYQINEAEVHPVLASDSCDGYPGTKLFPGMWILEVPRRSYTDGGEPYEAPLYIAVKDDEMTERWIDET